MLKKSDTIINRYYSLNARFHEIRIIIIINPYFFKLFFGCYKSSQFAKFYGLNIMLKECIGFISQSGSCICHYIQLMNFYNTL